MTAEPKPKSEYTPEKMMVLESSAQAVERERQILREVEVTGSKVRLSFSGSLGPWPVSLRRHPQLAVIYRKFELPQTLYMYRRIYVYMYIARYMIYAYMLHDPNGRQEGAREKNFSTSEVGEPVQP